LRQGLEICHILKIFFLPVVVLIAYDTVLDSLYNLVEDGIRVGMRHHQGLGTGALGYMFVLGYGFISCALALMLPQNIMAATNTHLKFLFFIVSIIILEILMYV